MKNNNKNNWRDLVPGGFCYDESIEFALQAYDEDRAKEMIRIAKAEGASQEDIEEAVHEYCLKNKHPEENISETLKKVRKMLPLNSKS